LENRGYRPTANWFEERMRMCLAKIQTKKIAQRPASPSTATKVATVMLNGQTVSIGGSPRRNRRSARQCETLESAIAAIPMMISIVPN
jgi:hypothetical protein